MKISYLVNLIVVLNIILTFSISVKYAGIGLKTKVSPVYEKPRTWLQAIPKFLSTIIFLLVIVSLFGFGRLELENNTVKVVQIIFLGIYVLMSWLQIKSYNALGDIYTQDIVVFKNHKIITTGPYKFSRHPIYLTQMIQDLAVGIAMLSWIVVPLVIIFEIPILILRGNYEEKLLIKNFPQEYSNYKSKVSKWIPYV